ncbi:BglII/BstYI family type II restriction endonuclease [Jannaschia sp. LMIT008]|uniref:BglII/BstYI family type II restriction endonuclease n=1 Tax=Jannaschia maritima TaxID=3032585 RepID=UPI0028116003|nr:BglII/BstYI family type II restriction endonuclease [Jannaschia sp. LMIT008]
MNGTQPGLFDADVSAGDVADAAALVDRHVPADIRARFEVFSYRNAATILAGSFPDQYAQVLDALRRFRITKTMIRSPGGSKGPIAKYVDTLFGPDWQETRVAADLNVRLHSARDGRVLARYDRMGFLDGHRIDFVHGRVALDLEWNSKDQTYDRDLAAFGAFYASGAVDVGIILTRGASLDARYLRSLGRVLNDDGTEGATPVAAKFGASTTWMGKLLYRLDAGRNGGCPVLALGITPACVADS